MNTRTVVKVLTIVVNVITVAIPIIEVATRKRLG
jgi:hypothetical protein